MSQGGVSKKYRDGLVSVIIPTYNRQELLNEAILSVINQTYRPIECIVIDDGSTDGTESSVFDLKEKYRSNDFHLIYYYQENSGAQVARNKGTQNSKGAYIQHLDSDDILYPDKIKTQVNYLIDNPNVDVVYGDWDKGLPDKKEFIKGIREADLLTQFLGKQCIHTLSFLFTRKAAELIGPWDIEIKRNQEVDFQLRGVMNGCNFQYIPSHTGLWRTHDGIRIVNATGLEHILFFYKKWLRILSSKKLLHEPLNKAISNKLFWQGINYIGLASQSMVLKVFKMSYALDPSRAEFNTSGFKFLKYCLGKTIAFQYLIFKIKNA